MKAKKESFDVIIETPHRGPISIPVSYGHFDYRGTVASILLPIMVERVARWLENRKESDPDLSSMTGLSESWKLEGEIIHDMLTNGKYDEMMADVKKELFKLKR